MIDLLFQKVVNFFITPLRHALKGMSMTYTTTITLVGKNIGSIPCIERRMLLSGLSECGAVAYMY